MQASTPWLSPITLASNNPLADQTASINTIAHHSSLKLRSSARSSSQLNSRSHSPTLSSTPSQRRVETRFNSGRHLLPAEEKA
eukprot:2844752-Rhodomonas_salina.1